MFNRWPNKIHSELGSPTPLGPNLVGKGVNFSLFSKKAKTVSLGLFKKGKKQPFYQFALDPEKNRTGDMWHLYLENLPKECEYAFKIDGNWLLDPLAKSLTTERTWGKKAPFIRGGLFFDSFDWKGTSSPHIPENELIIYEMHVRGFTNHHSSRVAHPGSYLGLIEKIPYLQELGINAVELLPIFEFDETANSHHHPKTGKALFNYWGYSTQGFFAPMKRYAARSKWGSEINEFKEMVRALHKAGIEVILDVVFNHTSEDMSLKNIDATTYYLLGEKGEWLNFSGCGNTMNCNHPVTQEFIISALRYWVSEMHVDGFRFDLASIFCRGENGVVLESPPLIEALLGDPILSKTKLIAEPWDCGGLYQVGSFPGKRFAEWNGHFRDETRRFLKGMGSHSGAFADALSGYHNLYGQKGTPTKSINFITAHDGFTLRDLVTYQEKHNEDNGEESRDGSSHNDSWNCGVEGPTDDQAILLLRRRQMRNFILALFLSQGTPMLVMGDEYGHTRNGNNNPYCQDNELNYFLWDHLEKNRDFFDFVKEIIALRKATGLLHSARFWTESDITWYSPQGGGAEWDHHPSAVCFSVDNLYVAFNAQTSELALTLPHGVKWHRLLDTSLEQQEGISLDSNYILAPYSSLVVQC
ncbi:MAG: hypothetical protein K940chlam2_00759 [Chlamydiae bacterium]|nr:hypothetical protein [Chlamydiota bacterium]